MFLSNQNRSPLLCLTNAPVGNANKSAFRALKFKSNLKAKTGFGAWVANENISFADETITSYVSGGGREFWQKTETPASLSGSIKAGQSFSGGSP